MSEEFTPEPEETEEERPEIIEAIEMLREARKQIQEICQAAYEALPREDGIRDRARSCWYAHIMTATSCDMHPGRYETTMLTTINEFNRLVGRPEEED